MTSVSPRLLAIAPAVPPYELGQADVAVRARHLFAEATTVDIDRLMPIFGNSGIDRRYSCVPIDWYERTHGWDERNSLFLENAVALLEQAARQALTTANLKPEDIDAIVAVSTTGVATPSLDALIMAKLGMRPDVRRLPVFGLGCAGGVLGLSHAVDLARLAPKSRVLFLVVELCALSFRKNDISKSNIVATALFGDGAAAAIISCEGDGPAFGAASQHTWPDTLDIMGWDVAADGLKAILSRDIPALVRRQMRDVVANFLDHHGLRIRDIDHFVCHPGGAKVLDALEEVFDLPQKGLVDARGVLRDYGNMSAVTAIVILDRMLRRGLKGRMLMTSMGPGFTAGLQLLDVA